MFPKRGGGGRTKISATLKTDQGWKSHSSESSPTSKRQPLRTGGARRSPRTWANEVNFTPEDWGAHSVKVQEDSIPCLSLPALSISTAEPGREKPGTGVRPAAERFLRRPHRPGGQGTGQGAPGGEARRDPGTPRPGRAPPCGAGCRNPSSPAAKTFPKTRSFSGTTSVSPASSPAAHSAQPHTLPTATNQSAPRGRLPVPGARDPKSHLIQRAARGRLRESPESMAPASPSRNFPDIALLSSAAENDASRQRRRRKRRRRWRWRSTRRRRRRQLEQKVRSIAAERRRLAICRGVPAPRVTELPLKGAAF